MAFFGEGVLEAGQVAPLVFERRLFELEVDLAYVRVEDDEPAQTHRRRFGHPQQLRHLARHVFVDARLAGQPPPIRDLLRPQLPVIGGFGVGDASDDADLALAARAAASTG